MNRLKEISFFVVKLSKNELKYNEKYILILIRMFTLVGLLACVFYYFSFEVWFIGLRSYVYTNTISLVLLIDLLFKFFLLLHLLYGFNSIIKDYIYDFQINLALYVVSFFLIFKLVSSLTNFYLLKFV